MRIREVLLATIVTSALVVACHSDPQEEDEDFVVVGTVLEVHPLSNYTKVDVGDLVIPDPSEFGSEEIGLHVYPDTQIFVKESDGSLNPGSIDDLAVGAAIEARTACCMRSDPPQANAFEIVVDRTQ